jgi:transcription elongation factor GreA
MSEQPQISETFRQALEDGAWDRVEELWLESLDDRPIPVAELLEVRRLLWKENQKTQARTLLELLAETLETEGPPDDALAAMSELVRLTDKPSRSLLERLEAAFVDARRGHPSLGAVRERARLVEAKRPIEVLEAMKLWLDYDIGTVVEVQGQGVGRVVDLNLELENVKVDIGAAKPVSVPFGAIHRYLRRLPEGDFLRRKVEEPQALAAFVRDEPGEALVEILTSLGGPSDVAAIKAALNGLLPTASWTSWWGKARKHPRVVSSGSGSRLKYEVSASGADATSAMLDELVAASPRDRLAVARRIASRDADAAAAAGARLAEDLAALESSDPGLAWETATVLADLPGGETPASASRARLLESTVPLRLLEGIQDRAAREDALEAMRAAEPDEWAETWAEWLLHEDNAQVLDRIATTLEREGASDLLDGALEAVFRDHGRHTGAFIWCCEAMSAERSTEPVRRRMTASVLEKLPDTLTKPEFAPYRARAKALLDPGATAIRIVLETATPQQASRFAQRISRLDVVEPDRQHVVEQAAARRQSSDAGVPEAPILAATRAAVEARRGELKELLEVEIPKTLKGINAAAAEGDLRENFEYHMLRDRQELQSARAAKLQRELGEVRILEPGAADASTVNIGTIVHFDGDVPPLTILGAWDADIDRRIFANGADIAQKLLGRQVGDEVEVDGGTTTISRIEPWTG